MLENNYIVLDCETGGLSPLENPITQIALYGVDAKTHKEIERYETYVKPYDNLIITPEALTKSMVSMKDINNGKDIEVVVEAIIKFNKLCNPSGKKRNNPIIVGHNVSFDISFLRYAFALCNKEIANYFSSNNGEIDSIDTIKLAKLFWQKDMKSSDNKSFNLGNCCKRAGIKLVDAHGAMPDVLATKKLLFEHFVGKMNNVKTTKKGSLDVEDDLLTLEEIESDRKSFQFNLHKPKS